jgi:hypothetical protein
MTPEQQLQNKLAELRDNLKQIEQIDQQLDDIRAGIRKLETDAGLTELKNSLDRVERRLGRKKQREGRKSGSIAFALVSGVALFALSALLALGALTARMHIDTLWGLLPEMTLRERWINSFVSFAFAAVLLLWVLSYEDAIGKPKREDMYRGRIFYKNHNWGIGFPTVTMVVTVIAAVIVIFTLTHELFKTDDDVLHVLKDISRQLGAKA